MFGPPQKPFLWTVMLLLCLTLGLRPNAAKCCEFKRYILRLDSMLRRYDVRCVKKLKIKRWEFLQAFSVFRRILLHAVMDKSTEGGLKNISGENICNDGAKKNLRKTGNSCKIKCKEDPRSY